MTDILILSDKSIAVVDDHDLIREGLNAMLVQNGITDIDNYGSTISLVSRLDAGERYDFYIVDLELPDIDGFVLIEMIRARHQDAKIIVCTVHDEIWTLRKIVSRNVDAIIYKAGSATDILAAMSAILKGQRYFCDEALRALESVGDDSKHPTQREMEVLQQISLGKTTKEIAGALFVSENTVEAHRKSLFMKLNAVNVADLIIKSVERGYINKSGASF